MTGLGATASGAFRLYKNVGIYRVKLKLRRTTTNIYIIIYIIYIIHISKNYRI